MVFTSVAIWKSGILMEEGGGSGEGGGAQESGSSGPKQRGLLCGVC